MMQSESIANLTLALSIVQGKMSHAVKDSANPFFKSKYADLESVWDACRSLLSENGLAILQFPGLYSELDKSMSLTTVISHKSGEFISQEMSVPMSKVDAQGAGSCLSYMRRYALAAVVGVVQADDDGNAASNKVNQPVVKAKEI
jgi:ERF superfamily